MDWGGGMMGGSSFDPLSMILGLMFIALFIAGFVLLVVWIVKQFVRGSPPGGASTSSSSSNALEILKERFAKGEINKEEFSVMKKELMK